MLNIPSEFFNGFLLSGFPDLSDLAAYGGSQLAGGIRCIPVKGWCDMDATH